MSRRKLSNTQAASIFKARHADPKLPYSAYAALRTVSKAGLWCHTIRLVSYDGTF